MNKKVIRPIAGSMTLRVRGTFDSPQANLIADKWMRMNKAYFSFEIDDSASLAVLGYFQQWNMMSAINGMIPFFFEVPQTEFLQEMGDVTNVIVSRINTSLLHRYVETASRRHDFQKPL